MSRVLKNYENYITSNYGRRLLNGEWTGHQGIDLVGNGWALDYIVAHSDGKVIKVVSSVKGFIDGGSYGNYVIIEHKNGYSTLYAHLEYGTIVVKEGDVVQRGQILGYMGETGTSYGKHLHFEVRLNDAIIDPTDYINKDLPLQEEKENDVVRYNTLEEIPEHYEEAIKHLIDKGYLKGTDNGLNLSEDMIRILVINYRAGLYN